MATGINRPGAPSPKRKRSAGTFRKSAGTIAFVGAIAVLLCWAWLYRGTEFITARHGFGYWCGIVGASMMAVLLLYPLRKRVRVMRSWGALPKWFRWHMAFGLLGPTLIIVHSNFEARSMNALVALIAMLIVAGSGLVGRYLYAKIHRGLYGAKLEAKEILADATANRAMLGTDLVGSAEWDDRLRTFEQAALAPVTNLGRAFWRNLSLGPLERKTRKALQKDFETAMNRLAETRSWPRAERRRHLRDGRARIARYFRATRRAVNFAMYERLFALWHVLHLPLIVLLVVTAIIHIVAVHLY